MAMKRVLKALSMLFTATSDLKHLWKDSEIGSAPFGSLDDSGTNMCIAAAKRFCPIKVGSYLPYIPHIVTNRTRQYTQN